MRFESVIRSRLIVVCVSLLVPLTLATCVVIPPRLEPKIDYGDFETLPAPIGGRQVGTIERIDELGNSYTIARITEGVHIEKFPLEMASTDWKATASASPVRSNSPSPNSAISMPRRSSSVRMICAASNIFMAFF